MAQESEPETDEATGQDCCMPGYVSAFIPSEAEQRASELYARRIEIIGRKLDIPTCVVTHFKEQQRITELYPWQFACLLNERVLAGDNLVFSTPTSAGKSLVADLLICRAFMRRKKALLVLPFVSMVEENTQRLSRAFRGMMSTCRTGHKRKRTTRKICVQGCHGSTGARGFDDGADLVICTFEKTTQILTRLHEENTIGELGIVVVDEVPFLCLDESWRFLHHAIRDCASCSS